MANQNTPGTQIALSRKSRGMSMIPGLRGTKQWEYAMKKFNMVNKIHCKFLKKEAFRRKWLDIIRIENLKPLKVLHLCSLRFEESSFNRTLQILRQRDDAVPSVSFLVIFRSVPKELPRLMQPKRVFPTGSTYEGTWNELGISGTGVYEFPLNKHGQRKTYVGSFNNGQFHGDGEIKYPDGSTLKGKWNEGELLNKKLTFADGLQYSEKNWFYCVYPDRRYTVEYDDGVLPAGRSYITSTLPKRKIPPGYYDTGDGLFDPATNKTCQYTDTNRLVRALSDREKVWVVQNCRTEPDDPLGPCPFLYEKFLEPMLEAEYPPPPAAPTKTYVEELQEIEAWAKQLLQARRQSYNTLSKGGRFSYHRRTTVHSNRNSGSRQGSIASRQGSHASSARSSVDGAPRKLMFDAGTMDKGRSVGPDHDLRHRSTFCERTRSLFRERSLQDAKDRERSFNKFVIELPRSTSDLQKKPKKKSKQEEPETSRSIFQRADDTDDIAFEIPQRHPNW